MTWHTSLLIVSCSDATHHALGRHGQCFLTVEDEDLFYPHGLEEKDLFTLLALCFPICKMELLVVLAEKGKEVSRQTLGYTKLTSYLRCKETKSHRACWRSSSLRSEPRGEGAASCSKESPSEECFMGIAENIGDTAKHKDTRALSGRSHPFCLTDINY